MRRLTAALLVFATSMFLSPGLTVAGDTSGPRKDLGGVKAVMEQSANVDPSQFQAELVDANGTVVSTRTTTDGTFSFDKVRPGTSSVRVYVAIEGLFARLEAGQAPVIVTAGATANVSVPINAAATAAAAAARAQGGTPGGSLSGAGSMKGSLGFGSTGTVLAVVGVIGVITAVVVTRNNDSSPSR